LFHWDGTGWCENSTRWKSRKHARARGGGAWAWLAHGLQCFAGRWSVPKYHHLAPSKVPRGLFLVTCSIIVHRIKVVRVMCYYLFYTLYM
jgi:hypothetical protein